MNKTCEQCGGQFVATQARSRFCSHNCSSKQYREKNRAAFNARSNKYREKNKAAIATKKKKYREENKTAFATYQKKYREKIRKQELASRPDRHCLDCHSPIPTTSHTSRQFCSRKCGDTYFNHKDTTGDAAFFELIAATNTLSEILTNTQTKTTQSNPIPKK